MSLESAKKYGYTASIINVILPIVAIFMLIGTLFLSFSLIMTNSTEFTAGLGLILGLSVAMAVAGIIALILFFSSMHQLSNYYKEPPIFRNILYGFLLTIIGGIISAIIILGFTTTITAELLTITTGNLMAVISQFIIVYAAIILVSMVFAIINGVFYWRAFTALGEKSGVENFKTTGLLYLIGSVTSIFGVGSIIIWIAWIFAAKSYKQLQPQPNLIPSNSVDTTTQQSRFSKIYCSACGTENNTPASYCKHCGNPLQTTQTNS
ncbi:MAG: DUF996 domain-containing protein [Nitrososphaerota archaeon]|jgi:uncharacterized membrane protein|nr:DUF996 domain-containing protein [Nitrososphaerota archaeon]